MSDSKCHVRVLVGLTIFSLMVGGAGIASAGGDLPSTPDGTVKAVMQGLAEHQPQVIWYALPPSYQTDITELVHQFAAKMDPELYNKVFEILRKAVLVLETKKEYILGSSLVDQMGAEKEKAASSYDAVVELLGTLMTSELADLERLRVADPEAFLSDTVATMMSQASKISKASPEDPYQSEFKAKLEAVQVEVVSSEGDSATLRMTAPDEEPEEVQLVRVEKRWVPKDMADQWEAKISEARQGLDELDMSSEEAQQKKVQGMMMLGMAEAFVDQLGAAQSAEEFEATLKGILGGFMGGQTGMEDEMSAPEEEEEPAPAESEG